MKLRFAKMHGLGNDFMVLDLVSQAFAPGPDQVRAWSDRHTGVGFDQLLVIEPPTDPEADFRYRIFNADGSEAEQCGNGARCVARFVVDGGLSIKERIRFQTSTGPIEAQLLEGEQVEVDMGAPSTDPAEVPCDPAHATGARPVETATAYQLRDEAGADHELIAVSMGNPHGVIEVAEITSTPVADIGAQLTTHPFFPERANIGFCQTVDRSFIRLRVFERGVGETRACGTGACAAVVAGRLSGRLDERVKVSLPGGKVRIRWQGGDAPVKMAGPAVLVYEGQIDTD